MLQDGTLMFGSSSRSPFQSGLHCCGIGTLNDTGRSLSSLRTTLLKNVTRKMTDPKKMQISSQGRSGGGWVKELLRSIGEGNAARREKHSYALRLRSTPNPLALADFNHTIYIVLENMFQQLMSNSYITIYEAKDFLSTKGQLHHMLNCLPSYYIHHSRP